jgi:hypothetical protein
MTRVEKLLKDIHLKETLFTAPSSPTCPRRSTTTTEELIAIDVPLSLLILGAFLIGVLLLFSLACMWFVPFTTIALVLIIPILGASAYRTGIPGQENSLE